MHIDPTVYTGRPADQRIPQEEAIYDKLEELSIPFARVDHDHADTMEDCLQIESVLGGNAGHMGDYLSTVPGSVSALELIFDVQGKVQLVIDRPLLEEADFCGHPGISTSTLRMGREDLLRYVEAAGHPPVYVDLPDPRETGEV